MKMSRTGWIAACMVSFALGIGLTWILVYDPRGEMEAAPPRDALNLRFDDQFMDDFFNDRFFDRSRDPFKEMDRMQKRMEEEFSRLGGGSEPPAAQGWFKDHFDRWFNNRYGDRDAGSITMREDDDYIYYDLALGEELSGNVNVKVDGNSVIISAKTEAHDSKSASGGQYQSSSISSFQQRFPLPANADPQGVDVQQGKGVVTVRIRKKVA